MDNKTTNKTGTIKAARAVINSEVKKVRSKSNLSKQKPIHLNFYQLNIDNLSEKSDNAKKIKEKFKSPPEKFRILRRGEESRISLLNGRLDQQSNGLIFGTLIHNQTNDLPFTFNDNLQTAEELALTEDQGLGYQTSFLFDPDVNVVMIESIKNGIGIGAFCEFFESNLSIESLDASVVINPTEIEKLNNMDSITKFQVKIARLQSGSPFKDKKLSTNQLIRASDNTNSDTLEISMSVGYRKDQSLSKKIIKEYIKEILTFKNNDNKDVKKLIVTGKNSIDGHSNHIDLLKERLQDLITVDIVRKNNVVSTIERYRALYSVYMNHKLMLHKSYKN